MSKQDIAIPRTVKDVAERSQARGTAIERKVETTYLKYDANQLISLLQSIAPNVTFEDNALAFRSTKGEEISFKVDGTPMTGYLFYLMNNNGLKCRICSKNDFNDTEYNDYSIWEIVKMIN